MTDLPQDITPGLPRQAGAADRPTWSWPTRAAMVAFYGGATALFTQLAWRRMLTVQLGADLSVGVLVLAAAMLGVAIGASWAGRRVAGTRALGRGGQGRGGCADARRPLTLAAMQQLLAAVALAASPALIHHVGAAVASVVGQMADGVALAPAGWPVPTALAAIVVLLNVPLGMTLPVAVQLVGFPRPPVGGAVRAGALCLAAAGAGAAAMGLLLLSPALGRMQAALDRPMPSALSVLALGHVALMLAMLAGGLRQGRGRIAVVAAPAKPARGRGAKTLAFYALGVLPSAGWVIWNRGLVFSLGGGLWVRVAAMALAAGALAVGGLVGARWSVQRRRPGNDLAALVLLGALVTACSPQWLGGWAQRLAPAGGRLWPLVQMGAILVPAGVLLGLSFGLLLRLLDTAIADAAPSASGRIVGRAVGWVAMGTAVGPVLGLALLEALDARRGLLAVAVGYLIAALWAEAVDPATGWGRSRRAGGDRRRDRRHLEQAGAGEVRDRRLRQARWRRIPIANIVLFAASLGVCLWQAEQGSMFAWAYRVDGVDLEADLDTYTLSVRESPEAVVAVRLRSADGVAELLVDRGMRGDDSPVGLLDQRRRGLLPLVLAPRTPGRAMVIGLGTGVTVAPLIEAGVGRIEVTEIVGPVINQATEQFGHCNATLSRHVVRQFEPAAADGNSPTTAPAGPAVLLHHVDGRVRLRLGTGELDLLLVDAVDPSDADSARLLSREFYQLAADRLADGGLFVQWIALRRIPRAQTAAIAAAFLAGFTPSDPGALSGTHAAVFSLVRPGEPMLALIGCRGVLDLSAQTLSANIARVVGHHERLTEPIGPAQVDLGSPEQFYAVMLSETELRRWQRLEEPMPGDDLLRLGPDGSPWSKPTPAGDGAADAMATLAARATSDASAAQRSCVRLIGAMAELADDGDAAAALAEALEIDPANALARFHLLRIGTRAELERLSLTIEATLEALAGPRREPALPIARQLTSRLLVLDRRFPWACGPVTRRIELLTAMDEPAAALAAFDDAIRRWPRSADLRLTRARLLTEMGRYDEAAAALEQAWDLRDPAHIPSGYKRLRARLAQARGPDTVPDADPSTP